ncbi:MAG: S-adenosylmethionine tRNA ribosyltransferase [Myxococcales bacterium]|nr:S-adenosylmethionine tRNA ribosyltransferase [Myxococcales bacterium]
MVSRPVGAASGGALAPARTARRRADAALMVVRAGASGVRHTTVAGLTGALRARDVLVVNDAATLPASLSGRHVGSGAAVELRLAANLDREHRALTCWVAAVLGPGDWREDTERRAPPVRLAEGDVVALGAGLVAHVERRLHPSGRLVRVRLAAQDGDLWGALYRAGRPIQYAYHRAPLEVWDQQTLFSGPPVAVEPPSSGFHLTWSLIFALQRRGVEVVPITHGTGLSTTGDPSLDAALPLPEPTWVTAEAAARITAARRRGARIIAQGTGVARALESVADERGELRPGRAVSLLRLSAETRLRVVSGLLTGIHDPASSHARLMESLVPAQQLRGAFAEAVERGYLGHEYGDLMLLLA